MKYEDKTFAPFAFLSIFYGIFFSFCLYKNFYGITSPILCIATLGYYFYCFKKLNVQASPKWTYFFGTSIFLLGISNMLTSSWVLLFFNYIALILLVFCFVLSFFYDTRHWDFSKYLFSLLQTVLFSIGKLPYPFHCFHILFKEKQSEKTQKVFAVLLGIIISIPLLFIICSLLLSADLVFRHFSNQIFQDFFSHFDVSNLVLMILLFLIGMLSSFCILAQIASHTLSTDILDKRTHEPLIAITFCSLLSIVYFIFSVIQILYLFLGNMTLPENYTYAEYAREGFFQLLFVCLINFVLVLFCLKHYKENGVLKGILTLICLCTYILIASSTLRMLLYIESYQLTFLRIFVLLCLFILAICLAGVILSIYKKNFPLFSFLLVVVSICYILFSLSRPDTYIASYNLSHEKNLDINYMYNLSYDALPVMEKYGVFKKEQVSIPAKSLDKTAYFFDYNPSNPAVNSDATYYCFEAKKRYDLMSLRKFNVSIYQAGKVLKAYCK